MQIYRPEANLSAQIGISLNVLYPKNIVQVTFETAFSFVGVSPPIRKPDLELDLGSCTPCVPTTTPFPQMFAICTAYILELTLWRKEGP